jgi:uncharacterized protein
VKPLAIIAGLLVLGSCSGAAPPPTRSAPESVKATNRDAEKTDRKKMSAPGEGMVQVAVEDVLQQKNGAIIVVLREKGVEARIVPIFIGDTEGRAIAMRLTRQKYLRPLTHDLLESVIVECDIRLVKVEIDDLKDEIFLAHLFLLEPSGALRKIDARPSDAIALALGLNAPIYIAGTVVNEIGESLPDRNEKRDPPESPATPANSESPLQEI